MRLEFILQNMTKTRSKNATQKESVYKWKKRNKQISINSTSKRSSVGKIKPNSKLKIN